MGKYLAARTFGLLITLLAVTLLVMALVRLAPGDPVADKTGSPERYFADGNRAGYAQYLQNYRQESASWFLDQPLFYISVRPGFYPDTLYNIFPLARRKALADLCSKTQNRGLAAFVDAQCEDWAFRSDTAVAHSLKKLGSAWLLGATEAEMIPPALQEALQEKDISAADAAVCRKILAEWALRPDAGYLPQFGWNRRNAFDRWFSGGGAGGGIIRGDWGYTALENRPVSAVIAEHIGSTLVLAFWALLLAIPGGVLLGYYMALYHERRWMRIIRGFTLILYVIPVFVLASFLLLYLATPEGIALFAPYGEAEWDPAAGFVHNLWQSFLHLALPVCALALGLTLFFGAQVRDWLLARFGKEYVRAALSRGIPFRQVVRRHIFPDIRVPLISMIGQAIPEIASGSVIIEYIFARRGLGQLILEASLHRDLYLLLALLWLTGLFTFTGNTLADLITARTDKRIVLK